jgi:uncharacterized Fe-S radical SAM superfamily protein PflX
MTPIPPEKPFEAALCGCAEVRGSAPSRPGGGWAATCVLALPCEPAGRIEGAVCRTGERAVVASWGPHHGEEDVLRGWRGSGTIFFSWCNLRCVYCQNWDLSQKGEGREVAPSAIADMMLELQEDGCHNINFVSPSHVVAQILSAVEIAARKGLRLPLVYNTGGYDSIEALQLLDGIVDIYMPDMKYGDSDCAHQYSRWQLREMNRAVREMHRQVEPRRRRRHRAARTAGVTISCCRGTPAPTRRRVSPTSFSALTSI